MITYAGEKSPFYTLHEEYCRQIEQFAQRLQGECSGFCNSYGFEVNLHYTAGAHRCEVLFIKSQSTQNGVIIPVDSLEYKGLEFKTTAQTGKLQISYGQSVLKRLLTKSEYKKVIPEAQFLSIEPNLTESGTQVVLEVVRALGTDSLKVENGMVHIKRHMSVTEPEASLQSLLDMVKKLESVAAA